jgi:hypothetical protein
LLCFSLNSVSSTKRSRHLDYSIQSFACSPSVTRKSDGSGETDVASPPVRRIQLQRVLKPHQPSASVHNVNTPLPSHSNLLDCDYMASDSQLHLIPRLSSGLNLRWAFTASSALRLCKYHCVIWRVLCPRRYWRLKTSPLAGRQRWQTAGAGCTGEELRPRNT